MADVVQILIDVLKINCSVVQCNYANPMESLFYLVFFPSVFIILFVYMLVDFVIARAGITDSKLIRLLLSVSFYAFIVFQELYTLFVGLSKIWYLALIIIIGLWLVIRIFFGGKRDVSGGSGFMPGIRGTFGDFKKELGGRMNPVINPFDVKRAEGMCKGIESSFAKLESAISDYVSEDDPKARAEMLKTIHEIDRETENAIKSLDRFLEDHPELKRRFGREMQSYFKQLKEIRSRIKGGR